WFGTKCFTGPAGGFDFGTRDNKANANEGLRLFTRLDWKAELAGQQRRYTALESSLSLYKTVFNDYLTLANRTGMQTVFGDPYFYQHAQIGGDMSLRGFNSHRFTGKTAPYNNSDARLKLANF